MSGKETIKALRKKISLNKGILDNTIKNKYIYHNKIINSNSLYKIENDDDIICEYSNELLNENIKLSGIISPFINPVPCFTVKNENYKKEIASRVTFYKNLKTQINSNNGKKEDNYDKSLKTKILDNKIKKSHINNKYVRPHSPNLDQKGNKLLISDNLKITTEANEKKNFELFLNKSKFFNCINKINNSKPILSSSNKQKIRNQLFYSTDNYYGLQNINKENKKKEMEENKNKKIGLIKLLGQKINVVTMKIEILQNFKKNKNLNSIKKKIEYNKIYCNNDLQRLKDNNCNDIKRHLNQIRYLEISLLKCEKQFIPINKHKEIVNKKILLFKIQKMDLIEKIILLRKRLNDFLNPDSTTYETYHMDESFEEQTINDNSLNDYSILKDTIFIRTNYHNFNKNIGNEESLYASKIIKINSNEENIFNSKYIKNIKDKKSKKKKNI